MVVLTIKKGLINQDGNAVTGATISEIGPEKIIYTGGDNDELTIVTKWSTKNGCILETSTESVGSSRRPSRKVTESKPVEDIETVETTEDTKVIDDNKVEEQSIYPVGFESK